MSQLIISTSEEETYVREPRWFLIMPVLQDFGRQLRPDGLVIQLGIVDEQRT